MSESEPNQLFAPPEISMSAVRAPRAAEALLTLQAPRTLYDKGTPRADPPTAADRRSVRRPRRRHQRWHRDHVHRPVCTRRSFSGLTVADTSCMKSRLPRRSRVCATRAARCAATTAPSPPSTTTSRPRTERTSRTRRASSRSACKRTTSQADCAQGRLASPGRHPRGERPQVWPQLLWVRRAPRRSLPVLNRPLA